MSLRQKALNGAKWSAVSSVMTIGLGILQLALLARMIDPKEFGLLTISLVILTLVDTLSDFGLSNSVIQRKDMSETELSTLYWLNIIIGAVIFLLVYCSSDFISALLHQPQLSELIQALSVAFIIIPQGQQFRALLQKELAFTQIGRTEVIAALAGFAVTLLSALFYPSALCAIWGYLTMISVRMLLFCYYGREIYRPQFVFELKSVSSNLRYGGYLTADSLINQLSMNMPTMLLSRLLGAVATGGYNGVQPAVMPPAKINPILTRVLFPAFAQMQDDRPRLRHNFYKMLSIMSLLNFVALLGMIGVAHNLVLSVLANAGCLLHRCYKSYALPALCAPLTTLSALWSWQRHRGYQFQTECDPPDTLSTGCLAGRGMGRADGRDYRFHRLAGLNGINELLCADSPYHGRERQRIHCQPMDAAAYGIADTLD